MGDLTINTRHFAEGMLPLLSVTLPFLAIGFTYLFLTIKKKSSQLLLYWLFIYPLAGAVVSTPPFTSRAIIGAPICAALISIGIIVSIKYLAKFIYKPILYMAILLLILFNFKDFTNFYFTEYPLISSGIWGWQYGPKEIITYFSAHENEYDDLVMVQAFNGANIFFKFYAPTGCQKCKLGLPENYYDKGRRQLFAVPASYLLSDSKFHYKPIKTIYYPNGKEAFVITEVTQR
jgi:hypothetical protein